MQTLGNLFYIFIFVGSIGSVFSVMLLFLRKVLRFALPLWVGVLGAAFYLVPIVVPQVKLVSPEEILWIRGYEIASVIWMAGAWAFLIYFLLRGLFAYRAIKKYPLCEDERIVGLYSECANRLSFSIAPPLLFGALKDPACVVSIFRPVVILNKEIVSKLSDKELQVVLYHELTHIRRKHCAAQRIYDIISVLYWFNPLVWVSKHEFAYICEMDCDNHALKSLSLRATVKEYIAAMLHLIELSSLSSNRGFGGIDALGFLMMKQRFVNILYRSSKKRSVAIVLVAVLCMTFTVVLSITVSRTMFYPYPAYAFGDYEYREQQ